MDVVLGILGETVLRIDGRLDAEWGRPKERAVLAALATQPGKSMSIDTLSDWLWDSDDDLRKPSSALQTHVSRIRNPLNKVSATHVELVSEYRGYRLDVDRATVDYFMFRELMARARAAAKGDPGQACRIAIEALALWRGTPMPELDSDRARNWRRRVIENEWLPANIALAGWLVDVGDPDEALRRLDELDRDHGDTLMVAEQRLRALFAQSRLDDAKQFCQHFRRRMTDDLDDESAAEIQRFYNYLVATRGTVVRHRARPDTLPDAVPDFIGRRDLLTRLDSAVTASVKVIVLVGPGGIGKTTLAVHWAGRRRFADGALYVDLNGFGHGPRVGETEIVDTFLAALGSSVDGVVSARARAEKLRQLTADRRMLVLLDNVAESAQVQRILPLLGSAVVLVTSRKRLLGLAVSGGARMVTVSPLEHDEGVALLIGRMGRLTADSAAVSQLADLCGGFPLALTLVGDRVATRPGAKLGAFVDQLRGPRLLNLGGHGDAAATCLAAVFELSYDDLSEDGRQLFRLLGLHPGLDIGVAAVTALAGRDVEDAIEELVDAHLLDQRGDLDRYQLHNLLSTFAAELMADPAHAVEREAAELRLQSFYFHSAKNAYRAVFAYDCLVPALEIEAGVRAVEFPGGAATATRWFEIERHNLSAVLEVARRDKRYSYWRTPQVVAPPMARFGWLGAAKRAWQIALELAEGTGDPFARGAGANNLGSFLLHIGEHDEAQPLLESALRYATESGSDLGMCAALHNIARVELGRGRFPRALELLEQALHAAQNAGSLAHQVTTMLRIGTTWRTCGQLGQAAKWLYQALAVAETAHDAHGAGVTLAELGSLLAERGDKVNAIAHGEQAVALLEEIHDLAGARGARIRLAQTHIGLDGDRVAALVHALRAVELARLTWHAESEATALELVGQLRFAAGEVPAATEAWRAAARIYLDRGDPRGHELARRLDDLGAA
jgi:DNA-binding SARP family transcriptional activator/tetratricopeptide (TPR) repeat protein